MRKSKNKFGFSNHCQSLNNQFHQFSLLPSPSPIFSLSHLCSCPSSFNRQYIVTKHENVSAFPELKSGSIELSKRAKGISRSYRNKYISFQTFYDIVVKDLPSTKINIASLKRYEFKIFLVKTKKNMLSKFNSKRFFSNRYKTKRGYFSFPLHFSKLKLVR